MRLTYGRYHTTAFLTFILLTTACASRDPFMDGRYWRQPSAAKPGLRGMVPIVGISGGSSESGVGPGFTTSGEFTELGGSSVGRYGSSILSDRSTGTSTMVGSAGGTSRSGINTEALRTPGVSGGTMRSSGFTESSTSVGTTP